MDLCSLTECSYNLKHRLCSDMNNYFSYDFSYDVWYDAVPPKSTCIPMVTRKVSHNMHNNKLVNWRISIEMWLIEMY